MTSRYLSASKIVTIDPTAYTYPIKVSDGPGTTYSTVDTTGLQCVYGAAQAFFTYTGFETVNSPASAIVLDGVQVLKVQQAGPGNPSFSTLANAQTWCQNLLNALRAHGPDYIRGLMPTPPAFFEYSRAGSPLFACGSGRPSLRSLWSGAEGAKTLGRGMVVLGQLPSRLLVRPAPVFTAFRGLLMGQAKGGAVTESASVLDGDPHTCLRLTQNVQTRRCGSARNHLIDAGYD